MQFPVEYKYSKEHTWLKPVGDSEALIGITEFAQSELGEIVYVDLPPIGQQFGKDQVFGSVEAVKTTSDLYLPASGEVLEVNPVLKEKADLVNTASFTDGWMLKVRLLRPEELNQLMDASAYERLVS